MLERIGLANWLDSRTGFRAATSVMLDEPLPPGTGWFFTLGSILLALLSIQLLTGAFLTLYYAPTPDHAYDSVRFITNMPAGTLVRGLHHFGASFIVVAMAAHMLRVIVFGSYKPPREVTWLSGLALLGLILAFALTGYLLPWDQRAYWATVVTINIAKLTPVGGEIVAGIMRGGSTIGALTLTRWYSAHVIFLPAALIALVAAHMVFMRRQGISGPVTPRSGPHTPFYPGQASRDITMIVLVLAALTAMAWRGMPPLEGPADPTDATFIPRPEWYFLGLFQLLKYFPGKWEVVGAMVVPGLAAGFLALLPWIDRGPDRDPRRRRGDHDGRRRGRRGGRPADHARLARSPGDRRLSRYLDASRDRRPPDDPESELRAVPLRDWLDRAARRTARRRADPSGSRRTSSIPR